MRLECLGLLGVGSGEVTGPQKLCGGHGLKHGEIVQLSMLLAIFWAKVRALESCYSIVATGLNGFTLCDHSGTFGICFSSMVKDSTSDAYGRLVRASCAYGATTILLSPRRHQ